MYETEDPRQREDLLIQTYALSEAYGSHKDEAREMLSKAFQTLPLGEARAILDEEEAANVSRQTAGVSRPKELADLAARLDPKNAARSLGNAQMSPPIGEQKLSLKSSRKANLHQIEQKGSPALRTIDTKFTRQFKPHDPENLVKKRKLPDGEVDTGPKHFK